MIFEAPPAEQRSACSFRRSICVHGGSPEAALGSLASLERAWDAGLVLGVPLPRSYDAYLENEPSRSAITSRDLLSRIDRAKTFSTLDARLPAGCTRDFDAARALYAASALSVTPAIDEGSLRAEATSLARLAVPCAWIDTAVFQAHPDRAIVDRHVGPDYLEGASLFFSWVDDTFAKEPGGAIVATFALAATHTPFGGSMSDESAQQSGANHWIDEPDVFDVLRASLKDALSPGSTDEDALVAFAVARAVDFEPAARLDWDIAWPSSPRALASPQGIAPTGAAYLRIDTKGRKPGGRFDLDASWEELARMRWVVVKLDATGREIGRIAATSAPKATQAHLQIVNLDDASALLIVAANVGPWNETYDPDDDVPEPHGWVVTVRSEPP